jgi:hypothetical protein
VVDQVLIINQEEMQELILVEVEEVETTIIQTIKEAMVVRVL